MQQLLSLKSKADVALSRSGVQQLLSLMNMADVQSILPHAGFRCYEAKIEKAGSRQESNPGHL